MTPVIGTTVRIKPRHLVPAALVVLAAALRCWHLDHGLPDFTEEAIPFKQAMEMWLAEPGRIDWNPHFFNYPSLSIYLHFFIQQLHFLVGKAAGVFGSTADYELSLFIDPTLPVLLGRSLGVVCDMLTVFFAWRIGERLRRGSGIWAALLIALAATAVDTSRQIFSDTVMTTLALASLERMMACVVDGGRRRFIAAAVLAGLAASAKYPAGLLVLPLIWVAWRRQGVNCWRWLLIAGGISLAAFIATSPYVVLDFDSFWTNFITERTHMAEGHMGVIGRNGAGFLLGKAAGDLGIGGLIAVAAALIASAISVTRRNRADSRTVLWLFLVPMAVSVSLFRMEATRYVMPLLPPAALLIGDALTWGVAHKRRLLRIAAWTLGAAAIIQSGVGGIRTAASGATTTQLQAHAWLIRNSDDETLLIQEPYGAELLTKYESTEMIASETFAAAKPELRRLFKEIPVFHSVILPMLVSGNYIFKLEDEQGRSRTIVAFDHASDLVAAFYDPRLFRSADYVVISDAVHDRYVADPGRYPVQNRLYGLLADHAEIAAVFKSGGKTSGPGIRIYRVGEKFTRMLDESYGELPPYWWTEPVPNAFRREISSHVAAGAASGDDPARPDGEPALWVKSLDNLFAHRVMPFALELALYNAELGHEENAKALAASLLKMQPELETAAMVHAHCAAVLGLWSESRRVLERSLAAIPPEAVFRPRLRLELARCHAMLGEIDEAKAELHDLAGHPDPGIAEQAERMLIRLGS